MDQFSYPDQAKKWGTDGPHFLNCLMNPSERKVAEQNWAALNTDVLSGAWQIACREMAKVLQLWLQPPALQTSVDELRKALLVGKCKLFAGKRRHYLSVRLCRSTLVSFNLHRNNADALDDYLTLSTMSKEISGHLATDNVTDHASSLRAVSELRTKLDAPYSLMDLVCYVCLRH